MNRANVAETTGTLKRGTPLGETLLSVGTIDNELERGGKPHKATQSERAETSQQSRRRSRQQRGHFGLQQRNGVFRASYSSPTETVKKFVRGRMYLVPKRVFVTLVGFDGKPIRERAAAEKRLRELRREIERQRFVQEMNSDAEASLQQTPDYKGDSTRVTVEHLLQCFLEERQRGHPRTYRLTKYMLSFFTRWWESQGRKPEYANDFGLTELHSLFRHMENACGEAGKPLIAQTKDRIILTARAAFRMGLDQGMLQPTAFLHARPPRYFKMNKRQQKLSDDKQIIYKNERESLFSACQSLDEQLMLALTLLAGLRNAEVVHLHWDDFKRHAQPPMLHIKGRNDWLPKTGERLVPLIYPQIVEWLDAWKESTPFGARPEDPIFADYATRMPYKEFPQKLARRLFKETGVRFSPTVARHTACSLFPLYCELLTGKRFNELEHSQFFGHDFKTSQKYYIVSTLVDLREREGLAGRNSNESEQAIEVLPATLPGQEASTAKALLRCFMKQNNWSNCAVARAANVSETAVRKFLEKGVVVPGWWFTGLARLFCVDNY